MRPPGNRRLLAPPRGANHSTRSRRRECGSRPVWHRRFRPPPPRRQPGHAGPRWQKGATVRERFVRAPRGARAVRCGGHRIRPTAGAAGHERWMAGPRRRDAGLATAPRGARDTPGSREGPHGAAFSHRRVERHRRQASAVPRKRRAVICFRHRSRARRDARAAGMADRGPGVLAGQGFRRAGVAAPPARAWPARRPTARDVSSRPWSGPRRAGPRAARTSCPHPARLPTGSARRTGQGCCAPPVGRDRSRPRQRIGRASGATDPNPRPWRLLSFSVPTDLVIRRAQR